MGNKKTTRRALLSSILAMLLCVAMLVGTTFAWFTDKTSAAVSSIQSGTLDVELLDKEGVSLEGRTLTWEKAQGAEDEAVLWEPNCTYNLQPVEIKNNGNLALKYKIVISGIAGDAKLNEAIEWSYKLGDGSDFAVTEEGYLLPGESTGLITVSGHMKSDAGNEYQGLTIDGVGITVVATQYTYENDSIDDQYDADAEYPEVVVTDAAFEAALDNPAVTEILVASDITFDWGTASYENSNALKMQNKVIMGATGNEVVTFKGYGSANPIKDVTISNINVVDETVGDNEGAWEHGYLEFENLTATDVNFVNAPQLNGTCTLTNCTFTGTADMYAAWINSGDITLKDSTFNGIRSLKIHEAYGSDVASVVVDGCTFNTTGKPGVVIGDLDAATSVAIQNSTFNGCAAGDQGMYIYESDTDVASFNFVETNNTVNNG